jgi:hypothetical protein
MIPPLVVESHFLDAGNGRSDGVPVAGTEQAEIKSVESSAHAEARTNFDLIGFWISFFTVSW